MRVQNGYSLLELLISLLVFALGLLAILDFSCLNFKQQNNALLKAYALNQLQEGETLLLNQKQNLNIQQSRWNRHNQQYLPQGKGKLSTSNLGGTVDLSWYPIQPTATMAGKGELTLNVVRKTDCDE